ncbi:MAG: radical SAM protein [Elusimicrobia bacterium]|nr:radical SAM protein [Elusimicrobiota bacterium]
MKKPFPAYLESFESGELGRIAGKLGSLLSACRLCPRKCGADRARGETGFCGAGKKLKISSHFPHFGEEPCLVGRNGSGTIFFAHCNLKCAFCQNYEISHSAEGREAETEELVGCMLELQKLGCHNINLVTPTHFAPQIVSALELAAGGGLRLPLVYNCGGYESAEVLELLAAVVDIYMPDAKFSAPEVSRRFCGAPDYFDALKTALKIMHSQVGDLAIENGLARRGLLIRHLVMPQGLAGTGEIMNFIAKELSPDAYVNIMAQYRPCGEARKFPEINRPVTPGEYRDATRLAVAAGLRRVD